MPQGDAMTLPGDVVLAAVAHAPDAVVIVDAAGTICYWNDGAVRIFGYGPEEMVGSTLDAIIPERLRQRHNEDSVRRWPAARPATAQRSSWPCPPATRTGGPSRSSSASSCSKQTTARSATSQRSCATSPSAGRPSRSSGGGSRRSRRAGGHPDMAVPELRTRIAEALPLDATAEVHARLEAGTVTARRLVRL